MEKGMQGPKENEKKRMQELVSLSSLMVPLEILADRKVSILEVLVEFLKEKHNMTYHEIAVALNRDDRTIWTCYNRAKKKRLDDQ